MFFHYIRHLILSDLKQYITQLKMPLTSDSYLMIIDSLRTRSFPGETLWKNERAGNPSRSDGGRCSFFDDGLECFFSKAVLKFNAIF